MLYNATHPLNHHTPEEWAGRQQLVAAAPGTHILGRRRASACESCPVDGQGACQSCPPPRAPYIAPPVQLAPVQPPPVVLAPPSPPPPDPQLAALRAELERMRQELAGIRERPSIDTERLAQADQLERLRAELAGLPETMAGRLTVDSRPLEELRAAIAALGDRIGAAEQSQAGGDGKILAAIASLAARAAPAASLFPGVGGGLLAVAGVYLAGRVFRGRPAGVEAPARRPFAGSPRPQRTRPRR